MKPVQAKFLKQLVPVFTADEAMALAGEYASPQHLLMRLTDNNEIIRLRRGLYADSNSIDHFLIANRLVSPSYISFESALSHYEMIPERVETTLSATTRRAGSYATQVGRFEYHSQKIELFSTSYTLEEREGYFVRVATPEKALLDTISRMKVPSSSISKEDSRRLVTDDLRIESSSLVKLSKMELNRIAPYYNSRAVKALVESF